MPPFEGQVVCVTGSTRGCGLAILRAFYEQGASVIINYLSSDDRARKILNELGKARAMAYKADVTSFEEIKNMFDAARKYFGSPVGIVVNNALTGNFKFNGNSRQRLEDLDWSAFDTQLKGSLQGALNTTKAAIPGLEELGSGRIINIGSNLVQNPVVPYQDYTSGKGALYAFTHTCAAELGPRNVTVNMVSGGLLRTTDASSETPDSVFETVKSVTPLGRVTTPEDVAGAVLCFASPWASGMTGQTVCVDGGLVMT